MFLQLLGRASDVMAILAWLRRCRHRPGQLLKDSRTYKREVTDEGETIRTWERKECRCGVVIEHVTETTNFNRTTVSQIAPIEHGGQPAV